jgi:DNA-binding GntR family transcriptional regulator
VKSLKDSSKGARNASQPRASFEPLRQRTTPDAVAQVLRAAILDGQLRSGSQLREAHIAAELGISRAPLREALGVLVDEGLAVKIPFRGAFVAEVSPETIAEIASLRQQLEPYAVERAAARLIGDHRALADAALRRLRVAADDADIAASIDAHLEVHRLFYQLADHGMLLSMWRGWETQLRLFFAVDHQRVADLHEVLDDHQRLFALIQGGDPDSVKDEIKRHVSGLRESALLPPAGARTDGQGHPQP